MRRAENGLLFQSLLELVPIEQSVFLVETSLNMLDWIHCVVHVPTYLKDHKEWIERLKRGDQEVKDEQLAVCEWSWVHDEACQSLRQSMQTSPSYR